MRLLWQMRQGVGSRGGRAVVALFCIAAMLIAVNLVAARYSAMRLDLTSEHLYTLARGTKQTLAKIEEPITLRLYYSTRLGDAAPSYGVYAQRVRELLDQYVAAANGKIRLEVYDPLPFSDAEDRAVAFGLQAIPLNDQGESVYFGLAGTNSTDDQQIVAFFNPERERFIEYDLTRLVHALAFPKRTVVGLMTALPLNGDPMVLLQGRQPAPIPIIEQLGQSNDIQPLSADIAAIPDKIDVLVAVHPQDLPDITQFAIDQFVLKGGKALIFLDPYCEMQAAALTSRLNPAGPPEGSYLNRLMKAWGLRMLPDVVAGDRKNARRVGVPVPGRGSEAMEYIGWLNLPAANLNRDDVITADLNTVTMASAGILEPVEGATTKFQPLIQTSPDAEKVPVEKVRGLPDVAALLTGFRSENQRYVLAARITGDAATAFPDGRPPPPEPPAGAPPPAAPSSPPPNSEPLKQSTQPIDVIVVSDSDMLDDRFWAQSRDFFGRTVIVPVANNADFLANAVEVLAGGQDLVDLRSRGTVARPFEVVEQIQRAADDRYAAEQKNLQEKLKQAQLKLRSLTAGDTTGNAPALTAEQTREIDKFRADMVAMRQQLRQVQGALREDIRRLKVILEFFDIALVPIVVVAVAIVLSALRPRWRRRRRMPA
jgi:ABC-type uncharacterized transport system involved in gliding motility auxiliary subunit